MASKAAASGARAPDADAEGGERGGVTHGAVHDQTRPAVGPREFGDHVADQSAVQRAAAVDDEHLAGPGFGQHRLQQRVVLVAPHGADGAGELMPAAVLAQLQIAAADVRPDVIDEVGGGAEVDHRDPL